MPPKKKREETISKAAELIGVPRTTLYSAVDRGEIPFRELEGGTILVDVAACEHWKRDKLKNDEPKPGRPASWD